MASLKAVAQGIPAGLLLCAASALLAGQTFEVATIKPVQVVYPRKEGPETLRIQGTLVSLLSYANDLDPWAISAGPGWASQDLYDVEAKSPIPATLPQLKEMLSALLKERFHLASHQEARQTNVYLLQVANGGMKLKQSPAETPRDGHGAVQIGKAAIYGRGVSTRLLAKVASSAVQRPVLDRTGSKDIYDFEFKSEETDESASTADMLRSFGLRLSPARLPLTVLVIDSAARPDSN